MKYSDEEERTIRFGAAATAMFNATLANTLKAVGDITPAIEHFRGENATSTGYPTIVANLNMERMDS